LMREKLIDSSILLTLAARLPDDLLRGLFPTRTPESIRKSLRDMAGGEPSERKPGKLSAPPAAGDSESAPTPLKHKGKSCILFTDGASRGNPGEAGAGIVLVDENGREIAADSFYLGQCTNNAAEYQALIAGLETALRCGCTALSIYLDAELIVRQITGQYKVRHAHLQPLFIKANHLLDRLQNWDIHHIPRSKNARADKLANMGIDERQ
jgi:ribonuclease HI